MSSTRLFDDRAFAIDTGPLLELLLVQFFHEINQPLGNAQKKIKCLNNEFLVDAFDRFMSTRGPLFSTPGVVVEVDRHVCECKLGDERQQGFRRFMCRRFHELHIEEKPVLLGEIDPALVAELGPVDAALLTFAQTGNRSVTLVTIDGPLAGQARKLEVPCMFVHEVLDLA